MQLIFASCHNPPKDTQTRKRNLISSKKKHVNIRAAADIFCVSPPDGASAEAALPTRAHPSDCNLQSFIDMLCLLRRWPRRLEMESCSLRSTREVLSGNASIIGPFYHHLTLLFSSSSSFCSFFSNLFLATTNLCVGLRQKSRFPQLRPRLLGLLFRGRGETCTGLARPSVTVRAGRTPGALELMVSCRHKMRFLCQAGAMNSFGDAALLILPRTGERRARSQPCAQGSSLRQTAECPRVCDVADETPKLRGRLEGARRPFPPSFLLLLPPSFPVKSTFLLIYILDSIILPACLPSHGDTAGVNIRC